MPQVVLHSLANATVEGKDLAARAVALMQRIIDDPQFLDSVRTDPYAYSGRMLDSGGYSPSTDNETIAQIIAGGKEITKVPDGVIDLTIKIRSFVFSPDTMGSVIPPAPLISTNKRFFRTWIDRDDVKSVAAHWIHEWMHVAGFYHEDASGDSRDVPYWTGQIAYKLGADLLGESAAVSLDDPDFGSTYLAIASQRTCSTTRVVTSQDVFGDAADEDSGDD
ncbi:MAG: hypothetical protein H0W42_03210 [Gemmatimonadaceae bacterium]|nr:hypothetical protein [Gemmatimonadaceae bacterium]